MGGGGGVFFVRSPEITVPGGVLCGAGFCSGFVP